MVYRAFYFIDTKPKSRKAKTEMSELQESHHPWLLSSPEIIRWRRLRERVY